MSNLTGHSLGRYHILEQLGEGGMAIVYKAYDTRLETHVAIKFIRTEKITPEALERTLKRFEREAKALAKLTHPNIIKVLDYGEHEGRPYLVMPYLPGRTLKQLMGGKPMRHEEAAEILIPIAEALEYAHQQGIIHRDIKPSNILLTESGAPMLSDFGVAKMIGEDVTYELTGTNASVGTPEYMAPEQVTSKTVDHRADIYALGVVYYEMIAGRKPYQADTPMAVLIKQASDPLPPPRQFNPNLSGFVEPVLYKALAKQPENRYESMGELANVLKKLAAGKPPEHPKPRPFKFQYAIGGALALAILFTAAYFIGVYRQPSHEDKIQATATSTNIQPRSTNTVTGKTQPASTPLPQTFSFRDDFQGSEISSSLWRQTRKPPCQYAQENGMMKIDNVISQVDVECNLTVQNAYTVKTGMFSTFTADMMMEADHNGILADQGLYVTTDSLPGGAWWAFCGIWADNNSTVTILFDVTNFGAGKNADIFQHTSAKYDQWYNIQLQFDWEMDEIRCIVDGKPYASIVPSDAEGLRSARFKFHLDAWRTPKSFVSSYFDNVVIEP